MNSPLTLRLDPETRERVARIARQKRVSASEVIREAIDAWIRGHEAAAKPYEKIADLIGIVHGGKRGRSAEAGLQLKQLLKGRRKRS